MPNPTPGVESGCLPIVNFWKNLSAEPDAATRAAALRNFYFNGIAAQNIPAVIDIRNYAQSTGQIRTNEFMGFSWVLREFKTAVEDGFSIIKSVSVKSNPFGPLFNNGRTDSLATEFRTQFLNNLGSLLITDIATFSLTVENDAHNNGQSHANDFAAEENNFFNHSHQGVDQTFVNAIQTRASQLGSNLTSSQVLNRAMAMTCAGCHQPSNFGLTMFDSIGGGQSWPDTLGFTHINEFAANGKFPLSPALQTVFACAVCDRRFRLNARP